MSAPRSNHAAILLRDGRVLICGGSWNNEVGGVLASAEIYDAGRGGFIPTGSMHVPRAGHTLTMLKNGKVLVIGGIGDVGYRSQLASAEIYDPVMGTFTKTGSMSTPREGHTATLLRDGRVLVTGGSDNGVNTLSSAEIYDPKKHKFHRAGHMTVPRESHTATLLSNGKLLITGGGRANRPGGYIAQDTAEIYDPATGKFTFGAMMVSDRVGHTATLLNDGTVLIVGGRSSRVTGTRSDGRALTALYSAELFDPEFGRFEPVGNMRMPRFLHTATLLSSGQILIAGGWHLAGPVPSGMAESELYDPATRAFATIGAMHTPRLTQTATLLPDGEVLVAGGVDALGKVIASAELYNPSGNAFALGPRL